MIKIHDHAQAGIKSAIKTLSGAPPIEPHHALYWSSFNDLVTERPLGMNGQGPIPWRAVKTYCEHYRLGDVEEFFYIVHALDMAQLSSQIRNK